MVKSEQRSRLSSELPKLLRPTTSPESSSSAAASSKKKLKGVRMRTWGSWVSEIRAPNQKARIWLGSYSTPEAAARAYDAALLCIKGPAAAASSLNFPISSAQYRHIPDEDTTVTMSPKSIQRIAAAAAAAATELPAVSPPPPQAPSPPSAASSPALSYSSLSEDDLISNIPPFAEFLNEPIIGDIDSWCNFESPKYIDLMMVNGMMGFDFAPSATVDDFLYDDADIRLWDFC